MAFIAPIHLERQELCLVFIRAVKQLFLVDQLRPGHISNSSLLIAACSFIKTQELLKPAASNMQQFKNKLRPKCN